MNSTATARPVPERIRSRGTGSFVGAVIRRFRAADGTSHTRALAYQSMFLLLSGFIGIVGLASLLDLGELRGIVQQLATRLSPGPSGQVLAEAARQGANSGATAAVIGLGSAFISGTFAMAQIERSANRLSGLWDDRPVLRRYTRAALLALTAGTALAIGGLVLAGGESIARGIGWSGSAADAWAIARWPLGILLVAGATFLLFRVAPRRTPDSSATTTAGVIVAVVLWIAFTGLLAAYFSISGSSAQTYGPLLAIIALLLWSLLTSLSLHLGLAVVAELDVPSGPPGRPDRATVSIPEAEPLPAHDVRR